MAKAPVTSTLGPGTGRVHPLLPVVAALVMSISVAVPGAHPALADSSTAITHNIAKRDPDRLITEGKVNGPLMLMAQEVCRAQLDEYQVELLPGGYRRHAVKVNEAGDCPGPVSTRTHSWRR